MNQLTTKERFLLAKLSVEDSLEELYENQEELSSEEIENIIWKCRQFYEWLCNYLPEEEA